jgi:hypothetical protein
MAWKLTLAFLKKASSFYIALCLIKPQINFGNQRSALIPKIYFHFSNPQ